MSLIEPITNQHSQRPSSLTHTVSGPPGTPRHLPRRMYGYLPKGVSAEEKANRGSIAVMIRGAKRRGADGVFLQGNVDFVSGTGVAGRVDGR